MSIIVVKLLVVVSALQLAVNKSVNAADCTKMLDLKPMECCKFPKLVDAEVDKMKAVVKDASGKPENFLAECKLTESMFNQMKFIKNGDLDEAEVSKFIDKIVDDAEWKPILQSIAKDCHKTVKAKLPAVIKKMEAEPFNVKKDQCNVEYGSLVACMKTQAFEKCPASKWTEDKKCAAGKEWVVECGKNIDSLMEMFGKKA